MTSELIFIFSLLSVEFSLLFTNHFSSVSFALYISPAKKSGIYERRGIFLIGERERANLVVRSSGIFGIYIISSLVRRVSAHARLLTRFFLSEIIFTFLHISHSHAASQYAPVDLTSQRIIPRVFIRERKAVR